MQRCLVVAIRLALWVAALGAIGSSPAPAGDWGSGWSGHDNDWDDRRLTVRDTEDIRRTFRPERGSDPLRIEVDDIDGSIQVVGQDGDTVELIARRTNRARSEERLEAAKQEVQLDIAEERGALRFYVRGPQRDGDNSYGRRSPGYAVGFDFELRVPKSCRVALRTVNDGDIHVRDVHGGWDVENVNGDITMTEMAGSGRVYALNGEVQVSFARNPTAESKFGSLNGDIDVSFRKDLSAKLRLKTRNGEAYTDFDVTTAAEMDIQHERRGNQHVYSMARGMTTQVGRGGPDLEFDAFNGDIRIRNRDDH